MNSGWRLHTRACLVTYRNADTSRLVVSVSLSTLSLRHGWICRAGCRKAVCKMQTPVFRVCSRSRAPQERVKHFLGPMILSGEKNCASVLISEKQEGVTLAGCLKICSLQKKTPTKISSHFYLKSASDTVLKHTDGNVQHFLLPALGAEQSEPFQDTSQLSPRVWLMWEIHRDGQTWNSRHFFCRTQQ